MTGDGNDILPAASASVAVTSFTEAPEAQEWPQYGPAVRGFVQPYN